MNTAFPAALAFTQRPGPALRALALLAMGVLALALPAHAQWMWQDANGQRVFSDTPPPPSVPERMVLRRPGGAPVVPPTETPAATPAAPSAPGAAARAPAGRDPELEARLRQAQTQEEQQRKAEEARIAKIKAENCERARQAKASLDSGVRLARVNAKGEREFLDDKAREAEMRRTQQAITENCQ